MSLRASVVSLMYISPQSSFILPWMFLRFTLSSCWTRKILHFPYILVQLPYWICTGTGAFFPFFVFFVGISVTDSVCGLKKLSLSSRTIHPSLIKKCRMSVIWLHFLGMTIITLSLLFILFDFYFLCPGVIFK